MSGRRWVVLLATVLAAGVTFRLGLWQLDRASQKQARIDQVARQTALPPLDARGLLDALAAGPPEAVVGRSVRLSGQWVEGRWLYLDNRQQNGRPGFHLLGAFRPDDGQRVLLVQRGWVPRDPADRTRVPEVPIAEGRWALSGRLAPAPARLYELGPAETGPIRQNVELAALAVEWSLDLMPVSLLQQAPAEAAVDTRLSDAGLLPRSAPAAPAAAPQPSGAASVFAFESALQRQWPVVAGDVGKHHGYAFQWFALSALTICLYVWFQIVRPRLDARRSRRDR